MPPPVIPWTAPLKWCLFKLPRALHRIGEALWPHEVSAALRLRSKGETNRGSGDDFYQIAYSYLIQLGPIGPL